MAAGIVVRSSRSRRSSSLLSRSQVARVMTGSSTSSACWPTCVEQPLGRFWRRAAHSVRPRRRGRAARPPRAPGTGSGRSSATGAAARASCSAQLLGALPPAEHALERAARLEPAQHLLGDRGLGPVLDQRQRRPQQAPARRRAARAGRSSLLDQAQRRGRVARGVVEQRAAQLRAAGVVEMLAVALRRARAPPRSASRAPTGSRRPRRRRRATTRAARAARPRRQVGDRQAPAPTAASAPRSTRRERSGNQRAK